MTHAEWFYISLLALLVMQEPQSHRQSVGMILLTGTVLFNGALAVIDLIKG